MDAMYEDLAWARSREPGLRPPTRHLPPPRRGGSRTRRHLAGSLRRLADRLDD